MSTENGAAGTHVESQPAQNDEARKIFIENGTAGIHIEDPKPGMKNDGVCRMFTGIEDPKPGMKNDGVCRMFTRIGAAGVHIVDQRPGTADDEVREMSIEKGSAGSNPGHPGTPWTSPHRQGAEDGGLRRKSRRAHQDGRGDQHKVH